MTATTTDRIPIGRRVLTATTWGTGVPDVIMLHDGLGSIAQWRSVPEVIAATTGRTVLAYDRSGHGSSTPVPVGPWPADWLHREAAVLADLIAAVRADRPALVGHSDGGSIAAIHAMEGGAAGALVLLAAHSWVERTTIDAIAAMRSDPDRVVRGLTRHHAAPAALFEAWSGVWTGDQFATWDVRDRLDAIDIPTLVVQGADDEYASTEHAMSTAAAIGAGATLRILPGLGHLLHHEDPAGIASLVAAFLVGAH
jgi:pimeloyl-ACP methyl ester carboxylesterase